MKNKTGLLNKMIVTTSVFALILFLNSCKKETFNSGITKEFILKSTANEASYKIKVGLPANYNPLSNIIWET